MLSSDSSLKGWNPCVSKPRNVEHIFFHKVLTVMDGLFNLILKLPAYHFSRDLHSHLRIITVINFLILNLGVASSQVKDIQRSISIVASPVGVTNLTRLTPPRWQVWVLEVVDA